MSVRYCRKPRMRFRWRDKVSMRLTDHPLVTFAVALKTEGWNVELKLPLNDMPSLTVKKQ